MLRESSTVRARRYRVVRCALRCILRVGAAGDLGLRAVKRSENRGWQKMPEVRGQGRGSEHPGDPQESLGGVVIVDLGVSFGGAVVSGALMGSGVARRGRPVTLVTAMRPQEIEHLDLSHLSIVSLRQGADYLRMQEWIARSPRHGPAPLRSLFGYATVLRQVIRNLPWAWRLGKLCRQAGIRVVHANNGPDLPTTLAAWFCGAALVVHLRGPYAASTLSRPTVLRAARFIAISDHVRETVLRAGLPADQIITLHNPVGEDPADRDDVMRCREALGAGPGTFLVGAVGRVVPWKGQLEFLQAAEPLLGEAPDLRLAIIGDGADGGEKYLAMLHEWVAARKLADRVTFTGFRRDVEVIYAALDLLVHSAIEPEPFGRVIVEAMIQGTPVIAAASGGPLEIISDGVDGLLRDPSDASSLGEAIRWCCGNRHGSYQMGEAGRRMARERFTVQAYAERVSRLYDELLQDRGRNDR